MSSNFPSSCILCPTFNNSKILKKTLRYFEKLNPQPTYYIFMTNNVTDNTINILMKWNVKGGSVKIINYDFPKDLNDRSGPYTSIALARQLLLNEVRKLSVDYGIFIDDDIFIEDKHFIRKIIKDGKDIVGGVYYRSYDSGDYLSFMNIVMKDGKYVRQLYDKQIFKLSRVTCIGGGCMCLSKKVINDKRLSFYPITQYNKDVSKNAEDFSFCADASNLDYEVWVDDRMKICHYQIHKEPRPWRVCNGK